jgi:hypothetical protein
MVKKIGKIDESWTKITKNNLEELEIGRRIRQPILGEGEIIFVREDRNIVKIKFDEKGEKDIRVDVVELEVKDKIEPIDNKKIKWFKKGKFEKMNNLMSFNTYIKEEYMYRHDPSTKEDRSKKQREHFISKLSKMGEPIDELEKMDIASLGRLLAKKKK